MVGEREKWNYIKNITCMHTAQKEKYYEEKLEYRTGKKINKK